MSKVSSRAAAKALLLLAALPVLLAGARAAAQDNEGAGPELLVLAPASLGDVLPRIVEAWRRSGGVPVRVGVDATSRIARQIVAGAPADVFVSADREWMAWVRDRGGVRDPVVDVAGNELVLIVPEGAAEVPGTLAELTEERYERVALAGENVPAGRYARRALERLGLWEAVAPRVVRGGSVRGALEWVARGEADVGLVYATDAAAEPRVRSVATLSADGAAAVRYPAAVTAATRRPTAARDFLDFLDGPEAREILRRAGFVVPGPGTRDPDAEPVTAAAAATSHRLDPVAAVRLSLVVGLLATVLGLAPAVAAGWLLARRSFPGKSLLSTVLLAPLVLPPVVTGFLLLMIFGRSEPVGGLMAGIGLPVPFSPVAPVLAALVVGFPLYVVAVRGAFEAVDPRFEELSWTLGRPPLPTFFRVALPLALPGVVAGAVLAFARALGEFGATVVLAGNVEGTTRTIPLAVYTLLEAPGGGGAMWTLVGASVVLSLLALLGYEALSRNQRRRLEDHRGP